MPIGPFSAGILSGGVGTMPAPAPPVPAPAMSGLAVNTNGSLVSMLPEVNDWFSPVTQVPTVQTPTTAHPCQSGGDCGCGGTCGGKKVVEEPTPAPKQPVKRDLKNNPFSTEEVSELDKMYGNTFIAGSSPNSEIVTVDQTDQEMVIRIRSVANATVLYEKTLSKTTEGWDADGLIISSNFPKISFGIAAFAGLTAQQMVASKLGQELTFDVTTRNLVATKSEQSIPSEQTIPKVQPLSPFPTCTSTCSGNQYADTILNVEPSCCCINYDLICSFSGLEADHQTLSLWIAPIGNIKVNIGSCCHTHDIAWYCASDPEHVSKANANLALCIAGQILNAALSACNKDLSCGGLFYWFCKLAVLACDAIAQVFVAAYDIADLILVPFGTAIDADFSESPDKFNVNGSHGNSCLCGGTEVTYQCPETYNQGTSYQVTGNPCRNVCLETTTGNNIGAQTGCFNCTWDCKYDAEGYLDTNSPIVNDGKTCCTGSAGTYSPCDGSACDSLASSCAATLGRR